VKAGTNKKEQRILKLKGIASNLESSDPQEGGGRSILSSKSVKSTVFIEC
jgi:hypothetical protein